MIPRNDIQQIGNRLPILGTVLFAVLYLTATFYYPGGSLFDKNAVGFSWAHNFWCNLLNDTALNGQKNTAKPIALAAMLILCPSLAFFWWRFPNYTGLSKTLKWVIRLCGLLAMTGSLFLLTKMDHDLITNAASLFGLIAMTGTFMGLYQNGWKTLFYFGLLNIVLVVVNNILYYHKELILYLPVVQKITFATFLLWVCGIDLHQYHEKQRSLKSRQET